MKKYIPICFVVQLRNSDHFKSSVLSFSGCLEVWVSLTTNLGQTLCLYTSIHYIIFRHLSPDLLSKWHFVHSLKVSDSIVLHCPVWRIHYFVRSSIYMWRTRFHAVVFTLVTTKWIILCCELIWNDAITCVYEQICRFTVLRWAEK